jgi:DNA-binding beta-propeller fold protein YncE
VPGWRGLPSGSLLFPRFSGPKVPSRLRITTLAEQVTVQANAPRGLSVDTAGTRVRKSAAGVLMDRDGCRAFIASRPDNYVAVLGLKTLEVTRHIDVGGDPDGLAWAIRP